MRMHQVVASIATLALSASIAYAGGGTAFTYQGRLLDAGEPANGLFNVDFSLWDDPAAGSQIGSTVTFISLPISDGLFTVEIDFGANAFENSGRWLEISVDGVPLMPRQPITRAPYAIQTRGIVVDDDQHVGMGVSPNAARLHIDGENNPGIQVHSSGHHGIIIQTSAVATWGVRATASHPSGHGLFGEVVAGPTGTGVGVLGTSVADQGIGVEGRATNDFGFGHGVKGTAFSSEGHGVHGENLEGGFAGYFVGDGYVSQRLFVGREDTITSAEYFGVHAPVGNGAYGGMYISTDGEGAWPFYGYAAGGSFDMWHYYDGTTGKWHLHNGGERLTVQSDGNVGIGTTAPESPLHVVSDRGVTFFARNTAAGGIVFAVVGQSFSPAGQAVSGFAVASSGTNYGVHGSTNSPDGYGVYSVGNVCTTGSYLACSDARFKQNVQPLADSLDKILKLRGVQFDWKRDEFPDHNFGQDRQVGLVAQEVAKVLPELVAGGEGEDEFYSVSYGRLVPVLVEAIKELHGEVQQRDSQITKLQARLTALEAQFDRLVLDRNGGAE